MKSTIKLLGIIAFITIMGFSITACGGGGGDNDVDITYTVTPNGTAETETTTQLSFVFSRAVSGLTAEDITITADTGAASKGTLTGSDASWNLGVTDVSAGTVKVKIVKTGIESAEKTVTVHIKTVTTQGEIDDTADGSSIEQAITLSITQWKNGSVATGEAKWYKFEAASGTSYNVQWKDKNNKLVSDTYTAWIKVTAYQSDGTTNISTVNGATGGWEYPRTVSGLSGTVYLKVEPYSSTPSYAGTYTIRFYNPAVMVPQVPITISSVSAVPFPCVVVSLNYIYSGTGVTGYRVYRSDTETGAYTKISADITGSLTLHYIDTSVIVGSTYWYKVAAYNSVGEGDKSDAKHSDTVPHTGEGTSLSVGGLITDGNLYTATQVDWYKFSAASGTTYKVSWADYYQKPDGSAYTADIKVSAFQSDGTPITSIQNEDSGWTISNTFSGVSGMVYLKVEAYIFAGTTKTGTYGIMVSIN